MLDQGAANIDRNLDSDPAVKERLLFTLGKAYEGLGVYDRAQGLYERSLALCRRLYGDPSKPVAESLNMLVSNAIQAEQFSVAEKNAETMLNMTQLLTGNASEATSDALQTMAVVQFLENNFPAAAANMRQAIAEQAALILAR